MKNTWRWIGIGLTVSLILTSCTIVSGDGQDSAPPTEDSATSGGQTALPSNTPQAITPRESGEGETPEKEYRIVTLLPPDAIPAIDEPEFLSATEADAEYEVDEQVLGVVFGGEARAYSVSLLSRHEIVNDTVAGRKIAVTW